MKIIEPSATLVDEINPDEILLKLETCGRVSHQSGGRPLHTYGAKERAESFLVSKTSFKSCSAEGSKIHSF